jgi:hypothetical protein
MLRVIGSALVLSFLAVALGCSGAPVSSVNKAGGGSNAPGDPSPAGAVSIFPTRETLRIGAKRQFSGWDSTVSQYAVTWTVQEGAAGGSVTADGVYSAPSATGTFHLVATSIANPSLSATAAVTVVSVGFVPIADMATARSGHTATLLLDGRVLIAGGTVDSAHSAELFDPASDSFTPISGAMLQVRSGHCASMLSDGRVLIAGGGDLNGNLFKTAELFDPAAQSFSTTGNLSQGRKGATATPLPNGKVLIAGGQDSGGAVLSSAELYDPSTGTFTLTGNMHFPHSQHTATLLPSGKVLLVGNINVTGSAELFDPASGLFSATGSMVQARAHHTATLLPNGEVLVLGGTQIAAPVGGGAASAPVSLDSAEIYDSSKGSFHTAGKLLIARDSHSATLLPNGSVLVAGGYSHSFDGDAQPEWNSMFVAELFDPASSVSTTAASLAGARADHAATMLNNGEVLITGGVWGFQQLCCKPKPVSGPLASSELYK